MLLVGFFYTTCRYTQNNFSTAMAKNAKLTIVEVRFIIHNLSVPAGNSIGRQIRSFQLVLSRQMQSICLVYTSIASFLPQNQNESRSRPWQGMKEPRSRIPRRLPRWITDIALRSGQPRKYEMVTMLISGLVCQLL